MLSNCKQSCFMCNKGPSARQIKVFRNSECMDLDQRTGNVIVFPCHSGSNQKWRYDTRTKEVRVGNSGNSCLTSSSSSSNISVSVCNDSKQQKFYLKSNGTWRVADDNSQAKCLDMHGTTKNVQKFTCHGGSNQNFYLA